MFLPLSSRRVISVESNGCTTVMSFSSSWAIERDVSQTQLNQPLGEEEAEGGGGGGGREREREGVRRRKKA